MAELHPNAQTVLRGFQAFAEGDMAAMKGVFADDATWHNGGRNRWSGDYTGIDSILRFFGEISQDAQIENELHAVLADDDHVVTLVNAKLSRNGESISVQNVFIFHLSGGKVTECWTTAIDPYSADAFWGD